MSPKRACHRLATVYLACIHMQIPIDMTTFTYCIFALGHILARQFPIVGFRPPVRLIDIIGRAADTRLHFYLHTFADQFDPARISLHIYPMDLCVCVFFSFFFFAVCHLPYRGGDDFRLVFPREERTRSSDDSIAIALSCIV